MDFPRASRRPRELATVPLFVLLSAATVANADVTLVAEKDSFVQSGQNDVNEGANEYLRVSRSGKNRTLVGFDLSGVSLAGVTTATLELTVFDASDWGRRGRPVDVHLLSVPWTEGNGGNGGANNQGTGSGVTWNCASDADISNRATDCAAQWDGGAFDTPATASVTHTSGMTGVVTWDVTADILSLGGAASEISWIVKKRKEARSGDAAYRSREGAAAFGDLNLAPRLVLQGPDNRAPTANDDAALAPTGETVAIDVLANDFDPDGDALRLVFVDNPALIVDDRVEVSFSDAGNHNLQYSVEDTHGNAASATILVAAGPLSSTSLTASRDSFIRRGQPDRNEGSRDFLQATGNARTVVAFDLTTIDTTRIFRASLALEIASSSNWDAARPVNVHRLLVPFEEGSSSTNRGVTWNCAVDTDISNSAPDCGVLWNGGTFASATAPPVNHTDGMSGLVTWDVTDSVTAVGAGASEIGFLIKKEDEGRSGDVEYYSRTSSGSPPRLLLELIELPAPPPDITPPTVTAPPSISVPAADAFGTPQTAPEITAFLNAATATDNLDPNVTVTNDAPDPVPLGVTIVTFSSTDSSGNTGSSTSSITVEDQTAPVLTPPLDITLNSPDGTPIPDTDLAIVTFLAGAGAVDNVDGNLVVMHDAPSQFFPGTTTVNFFATDSAGLTSEANATVTVTEVVTTPTPVSGQNVNMVSGTDFVTGDPFLQRQNEPSLAVSTRNPMHLLGGANDYRTVDLPGLPDDIVTGDAWLGVFKSFDGGQKWVSTLLPGFLQDISLEGLASPLKGFEAGADPVVRAGTGGLFYYSGIVFDRGAGAPSRVFVARFVDNNNDEAGDPLSYVDTGIVDGRDGTQNIFLDKPWMAVDINRLGAQTCIIDVPQSDGGMITQNFPGGNVYVAYAAIADAGTPAESSDILFSRSADCGVTWSAPTRLSRNQDAKNQGATIAIAPASGRVYVAWRRFATDSGDTDAILIRRSVDGGQSFQQARIVAEFDPFDQQTIDLNELGFFRFRTNAYPTMTVDATERIYIAYPERGRAPTLTGDSRIVMTTSTNVKDWTAPFAVDNKTRPGHQMMPTLAFAAGKLFLSFYDFRDDLSGTFDLFVDDSPLNPERHTVDLRTAMALPAERPVFTIESALAPIPSARVTKYNGTFNEILRGFQQTEFFFSNLPLFRQGTAPFVGDYIDVAASPPFLPVGDGTWTYNTDPSESPVFQLAWTDNRDVRPPDDGRWDLYVPPNSMFSSQVCSEFDRAGMRDQNIYTARVTEGLFVGSPVNTKPLLDGAGTPIQRSFVVVVQNATDELRSYGLVIANQPPDTFPSGSVGRASFKQFPLPPYDELSEPPVTQLLVLIPARSSIARTVYVTSTERLAPVRVDVFETGVPGTEFVPSLQRSVLLNPDLLNPDLLNPDLLNQETHNVVIAQATISNPDLLNPDLLNPDLLNPDLLNPDLLNPDLLNPDLLNPDLLNPDLLNPDLLNPDLLNPDLINPDLLNPDLLNPDLLNTSLTDMTWSISNMGNTTTTYSFFCLLNQAPEEEFKYQLLIYKEYKTPFMDPACNLVEREHHELVANVTGIRNSDLLNPDLLNPDLLNPDLLNPDLLNPDLLNPDLLNPDLLNPDLLNASVADGSFFLEPGQRIFVTLRIMDLDRNDGVDFDTSAMTPIVVSQTANTVDAVAGFEQPPLATPVDNPLVLFTSALPQATLGVDYRATLNALGADGPVTWNASGLPVGIVLNGNNGQLSGVPTLPGEFVVAVSANDGSETVSRDLLLEVTSNQLRFTVQPVTTDAGATIPAVEISIRDGAGNLVSTATDDITLSIGNNNGGGTLFGPTTVQAVGGVATFAGLSIDRAGMAYTLFATAPGLRSALSHPFDVVGTSAMNLAFTLQPSGVTALDPFSVQVAVQDALGNLRSDASHTITLALGANPSGGSLFGNLTKNAVNGIATFTGLGIDQPGTGYTLSASAGGLAPAVSKPFDINAVPPSQLLFVTQPSSTDEGTPISAVQVAILDASNNLVTTASNLITIGIANNPFGGSLSGTTSLRAVSGLATFPDLSIDQAGDGYTLVAVAAGLTPATSDPFDIRPVSATINMSVARQNHQATVLQDGRILVTGGFDGSVALASAELFDPGSGTFTPTSTSMSTPRNDHSATRLQDGRVLVVGGSDGVSRLASAELFDPTTNSFQLTGNLSGRRSGHRAVLLQDGRVLVAGGFAGGSRSLATAEIYDPAAGTFSPTGSMNRPRFALTSTLLPSGSVLITGGASSFGSAAFNVEGSAELFDPSTGTFNSTTEVMSRTRMRHAAVALTDGTVLVVSGQRVGDFTATADIFDPASGQFTPTGSVHVARRRMGFSTLRLQDGRVIAAGGQDVVGNPLNVVEIYDPTTGAFEFTTGMALARRNAAAGLLPDGSMLVTGGADANGPLANAEILDPDVLPTGGRISGVVTDATTTAPVPGALVQFFDELGNLVSETSSATDGSYVSAPLKPSSYFVRTLLAPNHIDELFSDTSCQAGACDVTAGTAVTVSSGVDTANIDLALNEGGSISGAVRGATAALLSDVRIGIFDSGGVLVKNATTEADGTYIASGLASGDYFVRTRGIHGHVNGLYQDLPCAGFCDVTAGTPVAVSSTTNAVNIDFDLVLGGTISGLIVRAEDSTPLAEIRVDINDATTGDFVVQIQSGPDGRYETGAALAPGDYFLKTVGSGFLGRVDQLYQNKSCPGGFCDFFNGDRVAVVAGADTPDIDFSLPEGGIISGTVTDAGSGDPLNQVVVNIYDLNGEFLGGHWSGIDGSYNIGAPDGDYFLSVDNAEGFLPQVYQNVPCPVSFSCDPTSGTPVSVTTGTTSGNIDFPLETSGAITGIVTNGGTSLPEPGVFIGAYDASGNFLGGVGNIPDGTYRIDAEPGTYFLLADGVGNLLGQLYQGTTCLGCDVTTGTPVNVPAVNVIVGGIDFTLAEGATISGTVTETGTGTPLMGVGVNLFDASGNFVVSTATAAGGTYTTPGLASGSYFVTTSSVTAHLDELFENIPCLGGFSCDVTAGAGISVVAGSDSTGVDFELDLGATISGSVTVESTGDPVTSGAVQIFDSAAQFLMHLNIDGSGNYTSFGLPTGDYFVLTRDVPDLVDEVFPDTPCPSFCDTTSGSTVSVTVPNNTSGIDFALAAGGTISGRVTDESDSSGIEQGEIEVLDASGNFFFSFGLQFGSGGNYTTDEMPSGTYFVRTQGVLDFGNELFDDRGCDPFCDATAGDPVSVTLSTNTPNIDFALTRLGTSTVVTNTNDGGVGSLRQAILNANNNAGVDTVTFDIPGTGPHTISPTSGLPIITDPVVIDGTTQPGFAGMPVIELDGTNAGPVSGLDLRGNSTVRGLAINRFEHNGIDVRNDSNLVEGNFIGTDVSGTVDLGNQQNGISFATAGNNTVGGTTPGTRNIISGNQHSGIFSFGGDPAGGGNVIHGNFIGTDVTGTVALPNSGNGVDLDGAFSTGNTVGGTIAGARNVISGNGDNGVRIGGAATGNFVLGNLIGTDVSGTAGLGNQGNGVGIFNGALNNTIGGTTVEARNVISGNGNQGVSVLASNNVVQGNYIGVDASGTAAIPNLIGVGVANFFEPGSVVTGVTVGGTAPGSGNLISGNSAAGVGLFGAGSQSNFVRGNLIGTDASGTSAIGNNQGVFIQGGSNNTVGGTTAEVRNLVSGNSSSGITIDNGGSGNFVLGNFIGTDIAGTAALGNGDEGVFIFDASNNTVGGTAVGARNVISSNGGSGVHISTSSGGNSTGNIVQGNFIGTDSSGTLLLGNVFEGVAITDDAGGTTSGNLIGGTIAGASNLIAFNNNVGVVVRGTGATGNPVQANSIFSNGALGIDLSVGFSDGVTSNDLGDPDTGGNNLQNFPILTAASTSSGSGTTTVSGTLNSTASTTFRLEFFFNATCDPSGNGEGEQFMGSTDVTTDGSGNAGFAIGLPFESALPGFATATATDPLNNTSEFSACVAYTVDPGTGTGVVGGTNDSGPGSLRDAIDFANTNPGVDTITFDIPGPGPHVIALQSALPIFTDPIIIDGSTEPDFAIGAPSVILDGSAAGTSGITITAGNSTVRGLGIVNFLENGIQLLANGGNTIEGNVIGTDEVGADLGNGVAGILIDSSNNTIGGPVTLPGSLLAKWGSVGSGDGELSGFFRGAAFDPVSGDIFVADNANDRVQRFDTDGNFVLSWGTTGGGDGEFERARDITAFGGFIYVTDERNHRVQKFDPNGTFITKWGTLGNGPGELFRPWGIAAGPDPLLGIDVVYVLDRSNHRVQKFDTDGAFLLQWGNLGSAPGQFQFARGLALDVAGNLYVADRDNHRVQKFASDGTFLTEWGTAGAGDGEFDLPSQIGIDSAGRIYVADIEKHRVQVFDSDGNFLTKRGVAGNAGDVKDGEFIWTTSITLDSNDNVYVGSGLDARIQKFSPLFTAPSALPNTIAFSGVAGVQVISGTGNTVLSNRISGSPQAIDLGAAGPQPTDPGIPVLAESGTVREFDFTQVTGSLAGAAADTTFTLQFYFSDVCVPSAGGQGNEFMGSSEVTTDSSGNAAFTVFLPFDTPVSGFASATATDPNGNTTELGECVAHASNEKLQIQHTIFPDALPAATSGQPYSEALNVTGGTAPRSWTVHSGTETLTDLDLSFDLDAGTVSGTPADVAFETQVYLDLQVNDSGTPGQVDRLEILFDVFPATGGTISGTVTDELTGDPVTSGSVYISSSPSGQFLRNTRIENGTFTTPFLAPGDYFVRTRDVFGFVDEVYNDVPCVHFCDQSTGALVTVDPGINTTGIDFALAAGGTISGTITKEGSGDAVERGEVNILDASSGDFLFGFPIGLGRDLSVGADYTTPELPAGDYFVYVRNVPGFLDELYDDVACPSFSCDFTGLGAAVSVSVGADTPNIDFVLQSGGSISGTVTEGSSGQPVGAGFVEVHDSDGNFVRSSEIQPDGSYVVDGLPTGTYFVRTIDVPGLVDELYDNLLCGHFCDTTSGTPVFVTVGSETPGIDFVLDVGGTISGSMIKAGTGDPVEDAHANVLDDTGQFLFSFHIGAGAAYTSPEMPAGDYFLLVTDVAGFIDELYNDAHCPNFACDIVGQGTLVSVGAGADTPGIDFVLDAGGSISGTVTEAGAGTIEGVRVHVFDSNQDFIGEAITGPSGSYVTTFGLATGSYLAYTFETAGLVDQGYQNLSCPRGCDLANNGTPIVVDAGFDTPNIDFTLPLGGTISGRVTDDAGAGIEQGNIEVFDSNGDHILEFQLGPGSDGNYITEEMPAGDYFVRTRGVANFANELFNDRPCDPDCDVTLGDAVSVALSTDTPNIDFALTPLGTATVVTNTNNNGAGSLRQAILNANNTPGVDTVSFNVPGAGPHTISPMPGLPGITDPTIIDGTTQPGFAGMPLIELDGSNAGPDESGLFISAGNTTVRGLTINRFGIAGIEIASDGNFVEGNFLGTDVTGTVAFGNLDVGVQIYNNSTGNTIGGTSAAARNLISGNASMGVFISQSSGNVVQGNYIGTDVTGTVALGNGTGVRVQSGSSNNTIGGTVAGARNVISGNGSAGVLITDGQNNVVENNYIGTDVTGTLDVGNVGNGVAIRDGASDNRIGPDNVIAFNSADDFGGIEIRDGENFAYPDFTGLTPDFVAVFPVIDFPNTRGPFMSVDGITPVDASGIPFGDTFGARFTGTLSLGAAGDYTFTVNNPDDNVRILVDSAQVLEVQCCTASEQAVINLSVGDHAIEVDYFDGPIAGGFQLVITGPGAADLSFSGQPGLQGEFFRLRIPSERNQITRNSIFQNNNLGIYLDAIEDDFGVNLIDAGDIDLGPNTALNQPEFGSIIDNGGGNFTVDGSAPPDSTIEIFASTGDDPSGHGEGQLFLASVTATATGSFTASVDVPAGFSGVTATATDNLGNTSEFAGNQILNPPRFEDTFIFSGVPDISGPTGYVTGDLDGDGDLDLVASGSSAGVCRVLVLLQDANGEFSGISQEPMGANEGLCNGNEALALGDVDADGDLDFVAQGQDNGSNRHLLLFLNDNGGSFAQQPDFFALGLVRGAVALGDVDEDGDLDLAATGEDGNGDFRFLIFSNDGSGIFTLTAEPFGSGNGFGVGSSLAFGDVDSDGDLDLVVSGQSNTVGRILKLFRNDAGTFTANQNLLSEGQGMFESHLRLGDTDQGGDLDLVAAGTSFDGVQDRVELIHFTNTAGSFSGPASILELASGRWAGLALGDINGDGLLDFFANGDDGTTFRLLYFENASGTFVETEEPDNSFVGPVVLGDFDGDDDLDAVGLPVRSLFTNSLGPANNAPAAPSALSSTINGSVVDLSWSAAPDAESSFAALSYEVRLGSASDQYRIVSGLYGTPLMGTHPLGRLSAGQPGRRFDLASGTYFWQVRAIDTGLSAGPWSLEATFDIDTGPPPGSINVALQGSSFNAVLEGATDELLITLGSPAPAGGLSVTVTSNDPAVSVVDGVVNIAEGLTDGQATLLGVSSGAATVTASATAFDPGALDIAVFVPLDDPDFDGLTSELEIEIGTDPSNPDTDGDGFPDGVELEEGINTDPLDPSSRPPTNVVVANPPAIQVILPGLTASALPANVTAAAPPDINVVIPGTGATGGLPFNVTVAAPPDIEVVIPGSTAPGLPFNVTVAAPPDIEVVVPGASASGLSFNVTVAAPPDVSVLVPGSGASGGLPFNVTVAAPPEIAVLIEPPP